MTSKIRVGILYGGKSVEHEISLRSARNVAKYIDQEKFDPVLIGIDQAGHWYLNQEMDTPITSGAPLALILSQEGDTFCSTNNDLGTGKLDVVFPVLHGTDGEDGSIQGMLTTAGMPFVGTGVLGSAVAMDKLVSKKLLKQAGVPTSNFLAPTQEQLADLSFNLIAQELGVPFMAKPATLGSSVGVSKVNGPEDYEAAVRSIFKYDNAALFESYIKGRELECAVIGNQPPIASVAGEIIISDAYEFYTYEAKYEDPNAVEIKIPAQVDDATLKEIKKWSIAAYEALNCEDFARVDLFVDANGQIFINEINTIPGFTDSSMFPSLWEASGVSYTDLITRLIEMAMERHKKSEQLSRNYREA